MVVAAMNYYPLQAGDNRETIGQLAMRNGSGEVYRVTALPDGGPSHQHYAITGISDSVINRKLRISVKAMWRDFTPVKEG